MCYARWKLGGLTVALALPLRLLAAIVVEEHNPTVYMQGVHYMITETSVITILQSSYPGIPYDFSCFDDSTPPPYEPATIQAIVHLPGFVGTVELKVIGHDGREYGAENVDQIVFNYNGGYGPAATLEGFKIRGILGTVVGVENHVFAIAGDFSAASIAAPFYVLTGLLANMTITGDVPDTAVLQMGKLDAPYAITIGGDFLGDMIFHNDL